MSTAETPDVALAPPADALIAIEEAAEHLGITKATLYTWRSRRPGYGPRAVKVGGCVRYRLSDLEDWIAAHTEDTVDVADLIDSQRGRAAHPALGVTLTRGTGGPRA